MLDRAYRYVTGQAFCSIFLLLLEKGVPDFITEINRRAHQLYTGTSSASVYGHTGLNHKMGTMLEELGLKDVRELAGCNKQGNEIYIKQVKDVSSYYRDNKENKEKMKKEKK